jgi:hypothetical protein
MIEHSPTFGSSSESRSFVSARFAASSSPLRQLARFSAAALLMWTVARCILIALHFDRLHAVNGVHEAFWLGVRVDLITIGWALAVPILLLPITAFERAQRAWDLATRTWFTGLLALALMLEIAAPAFLDEYQVRPNRLALDYLGRPQEVLPMLWGGFRPR